MPPGSTDRADPYHVWLSEVMLQQTTVAAVAPYFGKFVARWPTVAELAAASDEDVMSAWAGLGYYSRARNLKACADLVANQMGGRFPETQEALLALPGIGDYTSAAIAAIAFGKPAPVVDGNIERVVTRFTADATPVPKAKVPCRAFMARETPTNRPGDFVQAMMDLGATICTPRNPVCALCPVSKDCRAFAEGTQESFPVKPVKEGQSRCGGRGLCCHAGRCRLVHPPRGNGLAGRHGGGAVYRLVVAVRWRDRAQRGTVRGGLATWREPCGTRSRIFIWNWRFGPFKFNRRFKDGGNAISTRYPHFFAR